MSLGDVKVALVHDELTRRGGAEVVLEELLSIFPQAHVYALYAGHPQLRHHNTTYRVTTSFLQRFPVWFRRHPARLLPLLPQAAEQFDLSAYDVVISSASGFAKALITRVTVPHICYCHTPTRYLWDTTHRAAQNSGRLLRWPGRALLHYLRLADFAAASRVDYFLANSQFTRQRIASYYRRPSSVVYPPIDTAFFTPQPGRPSDRAWAGKPFLVVGRLSPTKNFDQAIRVCEKLSLPLTVVGVGADMFRLRKAAGKHTRFVGRLTPHELRQQYRDARALLQPGEEDFGMAAAEALACGTPVIAYGRSGAREVVQHRVTGLLYDEAREEALGEALRQFLAAPQLFAEETLQRSVFRFERRRFQERIEGHVARAIGKE